ncbi:MAG: tRNA (guanosine(46)-N7)-methyltransferase TrmB [Verrucomicrobiota bacterium]
MFVSAEVSTAWSPEIVPASYPSPLDLQTIYGRAAALEVDLGCGDGAFLASMAAPNPARNFLGIERLPGRVCSACKKITRAELTNARVLRWETSDVVRQLLPPGSVDVFHLMFPDPWPKRRHHRRRLFNADFLASVHRALGPQGTLRITTDHLDYFKSIENLAGRSPHFSLRHETEPAAGVSTFGKRFHERGIAIHRLVLRKVSEVR